MAWFGKVIGGAIGAVVGGPVGAGLGAALGAAFDDETSASSNNDEQVPAQISWIDDDQGRYVVLVPEVNVPEDCACAVHVKRQDGVFVKGVDELSDSDGDFRVTAEFCDGEADFYVPYGALKCGRGSYLLHVVYFCPDPRTLQMVPQGYSLFEFEIPIAVSWSRVALVAPLIQVATQFMACDGPLNRDEASVLREWFTRTFELEDRDQDSLRQALKSPLCTDRAEAVRTFLRRFHGAAPMGVLEMLVEFSRADGPPCASEVDYVRSLAFELGFAEGDWEEFSNGQGLGVPSDHHATLGIKPGATAAEIKTAYRALIVQYHPDRVAMLPREFQELANRKSLELREAYESLMSRLKG